MQTNDTTNPSHYKSHPSGIECIEFTRHMSFNRGNALKYLWRAGLKDNYAQDIEKAKWYLMDEYTYQLPAVYSEDVRKGLELKISALNESKEQERTIYLIVFGEWSHLRHLAKLL